MLPAYTVGREQALSARFAARPGASASPGRSRRLVAIIVGVGSCWVSLAASDDGEGPGYVVTLATLNASARWAAGHMVRQRERPRGAGRSRRAASETPRGMLGQRLARRWKNAGPDSLKASERGRPPARFAQSTSYGISEVISAPRTGPSASLTGGMRARRCPHLHAPKRPEKRYQARLRRDQWGCRQKGHDKNRRGAVVHDGESHGQLETNILALLSVGYRTYLVASEHPRFAQDVFLEAPPNACLR